jgi:hypothetical protein
MKPKISKKGEPQTVSIVADVQARQSDPDTDSSIPCPFVYAKGKICNGHIVRIEAYKANLQWAVGKSGEWEFNRSEPRSHYHVFCSEKDNHAGYGKPDSEQLKFYYSKLPAALRAVVDAKLVLQCEAT